MEVAPVFTTISVTYAGNLLTTVFFQNSVLGFIMLTTGQVRKDEVQHTGHTLR